MTLYQIISEPAPTSCVQANLGLHNSLTAGSLDAQVAGEDTESQRLRGELENINRARAAIETKLGTFEAADVLARHKHKHVVDGISRILPTLHGAIDWHLAVVGSAGDLRATSKLWIQERVRTRINGLAGQLQAQLDHSRDRHSRQTALLLLLIIF